MTCDGEQHPSVREIERRLSNLRTPRTAWVGAAVSVEHEGLTGDILEHWPNMNEAAVAAWFMCICIVRSFQAWIPRILAHTPENQQECLE